MALPASDNFNRANAAEGANWTAQTNGFNVSSNQAVGITASAANESFWNKDAFPSDQYAQVTVVTVVDGGPTVRASNTGGVNYYQFEAKTANNGLVGKVVLGSATTLQSGLATPTDGSVCRIEVVAGTLKVFDDGVQVGTNQPDSSLTTGAAGKSIFDITTPLDNFEGGSLVPIAWYMTPSGRSGVPVLRQRVF